MELTVTSGYILVKPNSLIESRRLNHAASGNKCLLTGNILDIGAGDPASQPYRRWLVANPAGRMNI
jgi:hypothetical protein